MIKTIKSQKGITLISLIVYVIVMLIVVTIVGTITSYFYANVNQQYQESRDENKENTLDMYLESDLKNKEILIKTENLEDVPDEGSRNINLIYENASSVIYTIVIDENNNDEGNYSAIYRNAVKIYEIEEGNDMIFKLKQVEPNNGSIINEKMELQLLKNGENFKAYTINVKTKAVYETVTTIEE